MAEVCIAYHACIQAKYIYLKGDISQVDLFGIKSCSSCVLLLLAFLSGFNEIHYIF